MYRGSLGFASPEPAERIRQDRAAVVRVVAAVSENETEVVPTFREGGSYSQVGAEPVALGSIPVEIASRRLQKYPQRFLRRVVDQLGVAVAAPDLGEAPEEAQDSPEPIRPRPRHGECAAPAATPAADGPPIGVVRDEVAALNVREDLPQQKRCVGIAERVVLRIPVLGLAGIDEDTDGHGHLASVDQVVEDDRNAHLTLGIE